MEILSGTFRWVPGRLLGTILVLGSLLPAGLKAETWQTKNFFDSIRDTGEHLSFDFWMLGLNSVQKISFQPGHTNQYQPFMNKMTLEEGMSDGAQRLLEWDEINGISLGTLAHESWHAYYENYIRRDKKLKSLKRWMKARGPNLYWNLNSSNADEALDEAYAAFIAQVIGAQSWVYRILKRYEEKEDVTCEQITSFLDQIWSRTWEEPVYGYYYRDSIAEYWTDKGKSALAWITGNESLEPPKENLIFVKTSISDTDRQWIQKNLFEERLTSDFEITFESELKSFGCL